MNFCNFKIKNTGKHVLSILTISVFSTKRYLILAFGGLNLYFLTMEGKATKTCTLEKETVCVETPHVAWKVEEIINESLPLRTKS